MKRMMKIATLTLLVLMMMSILTGALAERVFTDAEKRILQRGYHDLITNDSERWSYSLLYAELLQLYPNGNYPSWYYQYPGSSSSSSSTKTPELGYSSTSIYLLTGFAALALTGAVVAHKKQRAL